MSEQLNKKQLELLYKKCREYINEKVCNIAEAYGGHATMIGCDWERELMDCLSGGMPLDQTTFREFLRRLSMWMSFIEARLDMEDAEGPVVNLGELKWQDKNGWIFKTFSFEYTFDNNMEAHILPQGVDVESLIITEN